MAARKRPEEAGRRPAAGLGQKLKRVPRWLLYVGGGLVGLYLSWRFLASGSSSAPAVQSLPAASGSSGGGDVAGGGGGDVAAQSQLADQVQQLSANQTQLGTELQALTQSQADIGAQLQSLTGSQAQLSQSLGSESSALTSLSGAIAGLKASFVAPPTTVEAAANPQFAGGAAATSPYRQGSVADEVYQIQHSSNPYTQRATAGLSTGFLTGAIEGGVSPGFFKGGPGVRYGGHTSLADDLKSMGLGSMSPS